MGVEDQNQINDVHKVWEHIVDRWDKLDECIITAECERDLELVWLQEENRLNIRPFLLLTFCHVLFLKGILDCLLVDWNARHVLQCVTAFQLHFTEIFNKYLTNTWGFYDKLEYFLSNTTIQFSFKAIYSKIRAKKQKESRFYGTQCSNSCVSL